MHTTPSGQSAWNALAMILFIALYVGAFFIVVQWRGVGTILSLDWLDIILVGLAAQRLTRLATNDKIFAFVREWFFDTRSGELVKPESGFRRLMAELIECVWCTSMWAALAALLMYLLGPIGQFGVLVLAISSIAMISYNCSHALSRLGK